MAMMKKCLFFVTGIFIFLLVNKSFAEDRKIVVFKIDGKGGGVVRDKIVKGLISAGFIVTPRTKIMETAKGLGYNEVPSDVMGKLRVASAMNLDGFVAGEVDIKGKNRILKLQVFATCENGIVHELEYDWSGTSIPSDTVSLIATQVGQELEKGIKGCFSYTETKPVLPNQSVVSETSAEEKKKSGVVMEGIAGRECELRGKNCGQDGRKCSLGGIRCGLPPAMTFNLGFLISSRNLEVTSANTSQGINNYKYEGGAYPLFGLDFRLNIGRFFRADPRFCIGLQFGFAHSFLLVSHPKNQPDVELGTKDMRLNAGVSLDVAPKPGKLPLWIFLDLGWGMHNFLVPFDPQMNYLIADYGYQMVEIGIGLRAGIVRRWLDMETRIGFKIPYTLGDAQDYYGQSVSGRFGYSLGLNLGGIIVYGIHWKIGVEWMQYMANFSGTGPIEQYHCPQPSSGSLCPSGSKSTDNYLTGLFMLGYRM